MSSVLPLRAEHEQDAAAPSGWRAALLGVRDQLPFVVAVTAYVALGYAAGAALHLPRLMRHLWFPYSYVLYGSMALCAVPLMLAVARWRVRDARGGWIAGRAGWAAAWRKLRLEPLNTRRVTEVAALVLGVPLLLNALGGWKSAIPRLRPFTWDARLDALDRALHFGTRPWELLQGVLGHPAVTNLLDKAYYAWFLVALTMVAALAWSPDRRLRGQFFLSFALAWILLGTVLATLLSSAGPCYFAEVTGQASPYAQLMDYLHRVDGTHRLIALFGQRVLWEDYVGAVDNPFNGISAMPSLHVAMPVLFALAAWRMHRLLGGALAVYAVITLLGSVHLGWHYAVDGYVSIAAVPAIWWASGKAMSRWSPA